MSYKHNKKWRLGHTKKRNASRMRYYHRHSEAYCKGIRWDKRDDIMILNPRFSDVVLHAVLGRSIQAVQGRRCRLLKRR